MVSQQNVIPNYLYLEACMNKNEDISIDELQDILSSLFENHSDIGYIDYTNLKKFVFVINLTF